MDEAERKALAEEIARAQTREKQRQFEHGCLAVLVVFAVLSIVVVLWANSAG